MYERRGQRLLTVREFRIRVLRHGLLVLVGIALALATGIAGYHFIAHLPWIDSLVNASMILSGMGPADRIDNTGGKLFASFYALFSGLFFIAASGVLLAPFLHRLLHHFHLEKKGSDS